MSAGVVVSVNPTRRGDTLAADVSAADVLVFVEDSGDFAEDDDFVLGEQWLVVGDSVPMRYIGNDVDTGALTLNEPVGAIYEAGTPVLLWDQTVQPDGAEATEYLANVQLADGSGVVPAVVPHELIPLAGVDNLNGAAVEVTETAPQQWEVSAVNGRVPLLDASSIDLTTLPDSGPGQTFSADPPTVTEGFAEGHAWWQVVGDEVTGFWRLTGGAWVAQAIVTSAAIESLSTLNLSTVNLVAVDIDGGTIDGATISGGTVQTAASGQRVVIRDGGLIGHEIAFYNSSDVKTGRVGSSAPGSGGGGLILVDEDWNSMIDMAQHMLLSAADELRLEGRTGGIRLGPNGRLFEALRFGLHSGNTDASGRTTVAHGLGVTPTVVLAQPTGAGPNGRKVYWITGASDATNIVFEHRTSAGALLGSGISGEVAWVAIAI